MATWATVSTRRVWCFDVENRPGPYGGGDFTFKAMLSLAGRYEDAPRGMVYVAPAFTPEELERFVTPLREGAMAVTHNGPRHDLPLLNGTLIKKGLRPLGRVLVSDTYAHLPKRGQAFSASLGNMAERFGVKHQKGKMSEYGWERAYEGWPDALEKLRIYNIGDVNTTLGLRAKLLELGLLGPPRMWTA